LPQVTVWQKPVLVLREVTERPEGVHAGIAKIVGSNETEILRLAVGLIRDEEGVFSNMSRAGAAGVYGFGNASDVITAAITAHREELLGREVLHIGRTMEPSPLSAGHPDDVTAAAAVGGSCLSPAA
jgi:hypothetical protein